MNSMSIQRGRADRVFDVLRKHRRRQLLVVLDEWFSSETSIDCAALAERIATDGDSTQFQIELTHSHLPKLDSAGFITWDRDAGTVAKGPEWEALVPFLRLLYEGCP